ncbi:MAG: hypothetical protein ACRC6T_08195 [Sarcina sp.]
MEEKVKVIDEKARVSFENLGSAIVVAEELISQTNVLESELNKEIENLKNAINSLRLINIIEFKGYDNVTFLSLRFDTENNKFVTTSNGVGSLDLNTSTFGLDGENLNYINK